MEHHVCSQAQCFDRNDGGGDFMALFLKQSYVEFAFELGNGIAITRLDSFLPSFFSLLSPLHPLPLSLFLLLSLSLLFYLSIKFLYEHVLSEIESNKIKNPTVQKKISLIMVCVLDD